MLLKKSSATIDSISRLGFPHTNPYKNSCIFCTGIQHVQGHPLPPPPLQVGVAAYIHTLGSRG
jgi:hypothetical protein